MTGDTRYVAADIEVGKHIVRTLFGLPLNIDTLATTLVAAVIVCGLGLYMARRATSGVPSKLQLFFETVVDYLESQVSPQLRTRAPFVVPLAVTIFVFILIANWLSVIPSGHKPEVLPPPTADVNLTYALGLIVVVWSFATGIRRRGLRKFLAHLKEPYLILAPINVIEEMIKPFTLALRLFGNIFAGTVMLLIISLLPAFTLWLPNVLWRLFDLFIGAIQAFIFALLTIIYFASAVTPDEHDEASDEAHAEGPAAEPEQRDVPARASAAA